MNTATTFRCGKGFHESTKKDGTLIDYRLAIVGSITILGLKRQEEDIMITKSERAGIMISERRSSI